MKAARKITSFTIACLLTGLFYACSPSVDQLKSEAEQGDREAQLALALAYCNGDGVKPDWDEAIKWLREACELGDLIKEILEDAEGGDAGAQCLYGIYAYYLNDSSWNKSAREWWHKAAEQGHPAAQYRLGFLYISGDCGLERDPKKAVRWWLKAAEQESAIAQNRLGECYTKGEGVDKNEKEAVKWYREAAELGHAEAQRHLGECYKFGKGVDKDRHESVKWFRKAAAQNDAEAKAALKCVADEVFDIGMRYTSSSEGVKKDMKEAVKWFREAAELGQANAQNWLGSCYEKGEGVDKDMEEAVKWYREAAKQGQFMAGEHLKRLGK